MATVFDVAKYILEKYGEMTAMKLQKLVYYSQAWTLVWDEEPLFSERIEAWANGAVVQDLYTAHRRMFKVNAANFNTGKSSSLTKGQKNNIDRVWSVYGKYTAQQLSDINHQEPPWINARDGLPPMVISHNEITQGAIFEYHSGIWDAAKTK
jgi:uncharacterized phage-associated protein